MKPVSNSPDQENTCNYLEFAVRLTGYSRDMLGKSVNSELKINVKRDYSLVTELDLKIEKLFREKISQTFPGHGIIGEEYPDYQPESDFKWIIDPIDGTQEFINQLPFFGTMIALLYKDEPIVGVIDHAMLDICCFAGKGLGAYVGNKKIELPENQTGAQAVVLPARADFQRNNNEDLLFHQLTCHFGNYRVFRCCYGHTTTLLGQTRLTLEHRVHIWDIAASQILIEEAGGKYSTLQTFTTNTDRKLYSVIFGSKSDVYRTSQIFQPLFDACDLTCQ